MGINSKQIKERAMEICESNDYQEARDEELTQQFQDFISDIVTINKYKECEITKITEDDLQGFIDSFTFPDENDWCMEKACGEVDDYYDAKYEEEKDRKMGL